MEKYEMDNLFMSIVIPIYNEIDRNNGEERLRRCLDRILIQECRDVEIICVDDGSTDKSLEVLEEYNNVYSNIVILHNQYNRGLGYGRNEGIRKSQGKYIWFVDADDYIDSMSIKILRNILTQNSLDVVCFDMKVVQEKMESVRHLLTVTETEIKTGEELYSEIVSGNVIRASACGQVYRRKYLLENNFEFTEGTIAEDVFFSTRTLVCAKKAKYVHKDMYIYHKNSYSISTKTVDYNYFIGCFVAYCNLFDFFYSKGWDEVLSKCLTKNISNYYNIAKNHFEIKDKDIIDLWMKNADISVYKQYQLFIAKEIEGLYIKNISEAKIKIMRQYDSCIVYGAGVVAKEFAKILHKIERTVLAYAVSGNVKGNPKNIYGIPVVTINSLVQYNSSALVIIATLPTRYDNIVNTLNELGFIHILKLID